MTPTTPLRGLPFAALDVETTGLDPVSCYVVEVAVVHGTIGGPCSVAYSSRVRPPVPIPPEVSAIHGITGADVAGAPTFAEIACDLSTALDGRIIAAYNAPFDYVFLAAEYRRAGLDPWPWPWLDLLIPARHVDQYERGKRLVDVAGRRGIVVDAHGAAGDAVTTALLLTGLLREAARTSGRGRLDGPTLGDLLDWQRRTALAQERDMVAYLQRKGGSSSRPKCPWHDLEGMEPPPWPEPERRIGQCRCGARITWAVSRAGAVQAIGVDGAPHECAA